MIAISLRSLLRPIKRKLRGNKAFYFRVGRLFGAYRNAIMRGARLFLGYDDDMVVFSALYNRTYSDSPRLISEALHAARPQTKIVWLFDDPEIAHKRFEIPSYVRAYNTIERRGVVALARARVVVDSAGKRFYLKFPGKGQFYLQTWHGDRPFKKIGYDNEGQHLRMPEEDVSAVMVGSDFGERVLQSAFRHHGEVIKQGCPRNDALIRNDPAECAAIRAKLGLQANTRVLLYAPTFRDVDVSNRRKQAVTLDLPRALDALERRTGEPWKCLVRGHYFAGDLAVEGKSERLIPATDYPEMADLLLISDALLTDYSSCAGDFVLLRRPIYLYQADAEQYERENREFYYPMSDYDYWIARSPEELDRLIEQTTPERTAENCEKIIQFYGMHETGHATEAAVDYIVSKLKPAEGGSQ